MQRVTITIDDDLVDEIDAFIAGRGYANRSEAIRDLARAGLSQSSLEGAQIHDRDCIATLSYVYDHAARELPKRLTPTSPAPADDVRKCEGRDLVLQWGMRNVGPLTCHQQESCSVTYRDGDRTHRSVVMGFGDQISVSDPSQRVAPQISVSDPWQHVAPWSEHVVPWSKDTAPSVRWFPILICRRDGNTLFTVETVADHLAAPDKGQYIVGLANRSMGPVFWLRNFSGEEIKLGPVAPIHVCGVTYEWFDKNRPDVTFRFDGDKLTNVTVRGCDGREVVFRAGE